MPVFPDAKLPSAEPRLVRQRKYGEYLVYATKGDEVQLRVRYLKVGSYGGSDMKIPVLDESGKRIATLDSTVPAGYAVQLHRARDGQAHDKCAKSGWPHQP